MIRKKERKRKKGREGGREERTERKRKEEEKGKRKIDCLGNHKDICNTYLAENVFKASFSATFKKIVFPDQLYSMTHQLNPNK